MLHFKMGHVVLQRAILSFLPLFADIFTVYWLVLHHKKCIKKYGWVDCANEIRTKRLRVSQFGFGIHLCTVCVESSIT